ncbi:MAG: polyphosphate polymerase domain-containing protein [Nannocystaceae bacterium]
MVDPTTTVIERREYKYLIDRATAEAVRAKIRPFCVLDPHAERTPGRRYTIDTLYLDTTDLSLFWANDHEQHDRFKLRVRGYAEAPKAPVFFEVKRRVGDVIAKSRGQVPRGEWIRLLGDPSRSIPEGVRADQRGAVERFLALSRALHVRPFTLVRYEREPYVSVVDDYARVTFDSNIRAHDTDALDLVAPDRGWRALDDAVSQRGWGSLIVLELKFTQQVPLWMVGLTRSLGLTRGGFSKYGTSIRAFYEPQPRRIARAGGWR